MNTPLLCTKGLDVEISGKTVCQQLDVAINAGQRWGLLGINGVGKTTLLHTLAGLRAPARGEIRLGDELLSTLPRRTIAQKIGVLLQADDDAFPGTAMETVLSGRHPWLGQWQWEWEGENDRMLALAALGDVGLDGFEQRQVNTLSGGERRRLALATLFTQNPQLFLLDEPTNHLDPHHQIRLLDLLDQRVADTENQRASVMILHDINLATRFCDHLILLFGEGEVLCGPAEDILTVETLTRLYGHPVIAVEGPNGPVFLPE